MRRPSSSGARASRCRWRRSPSTPGSESGRSTGTSATREELLGELVYRSFGIAVTNARAAAEEPGSALDAVKQFFLATLRDRDRFVLPLHGGPPVFTAATRERQAEVRTILRGLIERGQAAGELRADLTPEDLILATSLLSRPLPGLAPSRVSRPALRRRRLGSPRPPADRPDGQRPRPRGVGVSSPASRRRRASWRPARSWPRRRGGSGRSGPSPRVGRSAASAPRP